MLDKENEKDKRYKINLISSIAKYFSLITKSLVILTTISCFFYISSSVQELKTEEINQIKSASNSIYRDIYSNISYAKYQLYYVAKQLSQTGGDKKKINQILSSYKTDTNNDFDVVTTWNMFSWIDDKGDLSVDGFEGILKKPIDMKHRDYLPITKQNPNKVIFGKAVSGAISGRLIVPIAIGVDNDSKYIGSIVFGIDIEKLNIKLENALQNNFLQFFVVDDSKKIILKSSSDTNSIDSALKQIKLDQVFDSDKIYNLNSGNLFVKVDRLADQPNSGKSFYLVSTNNEKIFRDKINNLIIKKLFMYLIIFLLTALLALVIYKRVIKPIIKEMHRLSKTLHISKKHLAIERSLERQLSAANQAKATLLKSISHDLRNYISGISGLAEIIAENKNPTEENIKQDQQYAQMIIKNSTRMLAFAKDALDTKSAELGMIKLDEAEDCDPKELIEELLILNQHFVKSQEVKIITQFQKISPTFKCDRRRLRQVLDNLITNAVKYSKRNGEVRIAVEYSELADENFPKQIQITIQDNGIGMTKEDIAAALSGKGKDIDKSDLDKPIDSHGIGMSIVKQITEAIGIKMEIESEKGKGTIVRLWFDINEENPNVTPEQKITKKASTQKTKTILIADDEEIIRVSVSHQLKSQGYKVLTAKNGQEVLKILDQQHCDLILIDTKMSDPNDGMKTTQIIRKGEIFKNFKKYKTIPIIAFSGNSDDKSKKEAIKSGMSGYLEKPFNKEKFLEIIT